ncbi:MAG: hypothetical protein R3F54_03890 [Alphaproteobacteria bacterium]
MVCRFILFAVCCFVGHAALAGSDQPEIAEQVLQNQLNNLESQAVQRQGRSPTAADLLSRQDGKLAEQELRALKTRDPRNRKLPLLERQLDRTQRSPGSLAR